MHDPRVLAFRITPRIVSNTRKIRYGIRYFVFVCGRPYVAHYNRKDVLTPVKEVK